MYPEISFVDADTETIKNALIRGFEKIAGRTLYRPDPVRLFIDWVADIIVQERVNIDFSAKQNLPRYAEGEYLDSLAEIFKDTYRLEPKAARTEVEFTLSVELDGATIIPEGTRVTAGDEIMFATVRPLTIPPGELTGRVTAVCLTVGEIGNGFIPGKINKLVDIFPYFGKVENVSESAGGADWESDAAFYERMRESMETFSTAGPVGAYEYFARSASVLVADVKATSPVPGEVDVRILLDGGELPGEEILKEVSETLNADKVRPLTDHVTVAAPETVEYDIDLTYYLQEGGAQGPEAAAARVDAAVSEYKRWQASKMGRDLNPSYLIHLLMQTGIKRVEVRSPTFSAVADNAVAVAVETVVLNGGPERE